MNVSERIVEILEENEIYHVFGIPGEQIMPLYSALSKSDINHILMRHEQGAAHAADGYYRSSGRIGVCIATASPGALNFTMALATAYKDNIPILVLTGDNELKYRGSNHFQSSPQFEILSNIAQSSYNPLNGMEAIFALNAAIYELKNYPKGPVFINLSKDVLLSSDFEEYDLCYLCEDDLSNIADAQELIDSSEKLLFILGAGVRFCSDDVKKIAEKYEIPVTTTFHGKGVVSEDNVLNLGMVGVRGTPRANYALEHADCVIGLGMRASERTLPNVPDNFIHVNINGDHLVGDCQIQGRVEDFISKVTFKRNSWLDDILKVDNDIELEGLNEDFKPQAAIKRILRRFSRNIIVSDAGSHTTWTTLLAKSDRIGQLLFSGGLAPMGYGIPASIGASIATNERIIVITGDGDFQMNSQELAVISALRLDIIIFVLNNSQYSIIRQWQEDFYDMEAYQVDLNNPNFVQLAFSYDIDALRLEKLGDLEELLSGYLSGPAVFELMVDSENIPLP